MNRQQRIEAALQAILDAVDYDNSSVDSPVAVLPEVLIKKARKALAKKAPKV